MPYKGKKISVVIPAYNEEQAISLVVDGLVTLSHSGVRICDEVIVVNNASTDRTKELAFQSGAKVVDEVRRGYGYACDLGIKSCSLDTDIVVFFDGDRSCDPEELLSLIEPLLLGADITIGNRDIGSQESGSLFYHQKLGNKLITFLIHNLWSKEINDLGPFRAIWMDKLKLLEMSEMTFGWTVEMQLKSIINKYKMQEVPVSTLTRVGKSKISGTVKGTVLAAYGIIKVILFLRRSRFYNSRSTV